MKTIKDEILNERTKGNVVINCNGELQVHDIEKLVNQPVGGLLYDLNRDEATILTWIDDPKWINDYACAMVIRYLMNKLKIKKL